MRIASSFRRSLLTRRLAPVWMIVAALGLAYITLLLWNGILILRERPYRELYEEMQLVQLSLERWAVEHEGSYPGDAKDILTGSYIAELPRNPFDRSDTIVPLNPGDPPKPGGFIYIGTGPLISEANMQKANDPNPMFELGSTASPPEIRRNMTDIDGYILLAYGARRRGRVQQNEQDRIVSQNLLERLAYYILPSGPLKNSFSPPPANFQHSDYVKHNGSVITFTDYSGTNYICAPGIDWDHVSVMLTSSQDYITGCR